MSEREVETATAGTAPTLAELLMEMETQRRVIVIHAGRMVERRRAGRAGVADVFEAMLGDALAELAGMEATYRERLDALMAGSREAHDDRD